MAEILIPLAILVGLGVLFATILAVAYKKLRVYEDPRIDKVEEMLPSANCGACGVPGCRAFAEKVVAHELNPGKCTVSSPDAIVDIANYLGIEASTEIKRVARLLCAGGNNEAHNVSNYKGAMSSCRGEAIVAGGPKECSWGCLGLGDCEEICDFEAIRMNNNGLPVVDPVLCTACGDCVDVCPKNLFELMPVDRHLLVQCKSLLEGDLAENKCSVACTGCSRCVADAAPGVIKIVDNLAVINYELNNLTSRTATLRCPTDAIVWLDGEAQFDDDGKPVLPIGEVEQLVDLDDTYYQ
jgi:Na+-translocating ferredoxin:NAD+ oxidoreductase RNF subunit RnfB